MLALNGITDLAIDGAGAELMVHGWAGVFAFADAHRVLIENLTIDCVRPPFSPGNVTRVDDHSFDIVVDAGYPVSGGEPVPALMQYDRKERRPADLCIDLYNGVSKTELIAPQTLRCTTFAKTDIKPGMFLLLRHAVYNSHGISLWGGEDLTVRNVTLHCAPGMGLVANRCRNVTVDGLRVMPRPGSGRLMSATADATHFGACLGTIELRNCVFEGMGDDAVNIKAGLYITIAERAGDRTILGRHNLGLQSLPQAGDRMEFIRTDTLVPYATGIVKSARMEGDNKTHRVEFETTLPADMKIGDVLGNATTAPAVRIRDCTVRRNRARGFLLQTRDVLVEHCTFRDVTSGGIFVMTETVHFYEAIGTRDVTIRNCTFINCNYGGPRGEGVVLVGGYTPNFVLPPVPGAHRNITIEGNTIRKADNAGIFVAGTDGITLRNNTIEDAGRRPTKPEYGCGLYVMSSRDVNVIGNTVTPPKDPPGVPAFHVGKDCDKATLRLSGNTGF